MAKVFVMLKSMCSVAILAGSVILFSGNLSQAQVVAPFKKTERTIELNQDPFDIIQEVVENSGRNQQELGLAKNTKSGVKPTFATPLKYEKKSSGSPEQAQVIYSALVQKYGTPKSVRGQSHVWDIKNPGKSSTQADKVTVILKMGNSGAYELIMDRGRGENGRATWEATSVKKAKAKLQNQQNQQNQKVTKPFLVLQEDND